MSRFTKLLAIVLVLLAVLLGIFAYRLAVAPAPVPAQAPTQVLPKAENDGPRFAVVVARAAVSAGVPIKSGDLEVAQWPVPLSQGFTSADTLVGKTLRRELAVGEPVTQDSVMTGLARHLGAGERAVTIGIDEIAGGANQVTPGDYVDVFFILDKNEETLGAQARLLQSRLRVLAYGLTSVDGPPASDEPNATGRSRPAQAPARTATLAVPIELVNELVLAGKSGRLQLALRSPTDEGQVDKTLFAARKPVLPGLSTLDTSQKAELEAPENKAYAGDSLIQLSNAANMPGVKSPAAAAAAPRATNSGGGGGSSVQVWRGGKPEVLRY